MEDGAADDERVSRGAWPVVRAAVSRVPRAQIALVVGAILAIIGLTSALPFVDSEIVQGVLVISVLLVLFAICVLIFRVTLKLVAAEQQLPGQVTDRIKALESVSPLWVQVMAGADPGLTIISLELDPKYAEYSMRGERFNVDRTPRSTWRSDAVGLESIKPTVKLFYRWSGNSKQRIADGDLYGDVSGIGVIEFQDGSRAQGWYAGGDVDQLRFGSRINCRYRALEAAEKALWNTTDDQPRRELVDALFKRFLEQSH